MRRNQPQGCFYVRISMTGLFCYFAIFAFTCFVILFTLLLKASLTKYQAFQIFAWFKISNWFWCRVFFSCLYLLLICFVSMILVCSSGSGQVLWRSGGNLQKLNIAARFAIKGHRIYHVVSRFRNISFIFVNHLQQGNWFFWNFVFYILMFALLGTGWNWPLGYLGISLTRIWFGLERGLFGLRAPLSSVLWTSLPFRYL